jgi:hypothetical protein
MGEAVAPPSETVGDVGSPVASLPYESFEQPKMRTISPVARLFIETCRKFAQQLEKRKGNDRNPG